MKASSKATDLIKEFEGFSDKAYICPAGKITIGYGSTMARGKPIVLGQMCTEEEACEFLMEEIDRIIMPIMSKILPESKVNQNQLDAIISLCYNIGMGNFKTSTLLKKVVASEYLAASDEFLKWDKYTNPKTGKKEPLAGLTRRRKAERELFLS